MVPGTRMERVIRLTTQTITQLTSVAASWGTSRPIETIVGSFSLVTLFYFQLLRAIRLSVIFQQFSQASTSDWFWLMFRSLCHRSLSLVQKADAADILILVFGYAVMWATILNLFIQMKHLESTFWLAICSLSSSTAAFVTACFFANLLCIPIDPILLLEALPLLVITVGFDKPVLLAQNVFRSPILLTQSPSETSKPLLFDEACQVHAPSSHASSKTTNASSTNLSSPALVCMAVQRSAAAIVRDYMIEMTVLLIGALSGIGGLQAFCQLAALILFCDALSLFLIYPAMLTICAEVRRIKVRRHRAASGSNKTGSPTLHVPTKEGTLARLSRYIIRLFSNEHNDPTNRLKLGLLMAFLTLHLLNLTTTFTDKTALLKSFRSTGTPAHPYLPSPSNSSEPVGIVGHLETFLCRWTDMVADPLLSKVLVAILVVSIFLNGYLLRGMNAENSGGFSNEALRALPKAADRLRRPRHSEGSISPMRLSPSDLHKSEHIPFFDLDQSSKSPHFTKTSSTKTQLQKYALQNHQSRSPSRRHKSASDEVITFESDTEHGRGTQALYISCVTNDRSQPSSSRRSRKSDSL